MIWLYKDLTALYIVAVIAALAVETAFMKTEIIGFLSIYIIALVWIILCAVFFALKANKRFKALIDVLNSCDCRTFILKTEELLKRSNKYTKNLLFINLSTGYISLGEIKKAFSALQSVTENFKNNAAGAAQRAVYYNNLAAAYLQAGYMENAGKALESLKLALENPKLNEYHRIDGYDHFQNLRYLKNMKSGNYKGAEEFYLNYLEKQDKLLGKVSCNFILAQIYLHNGETEKAEECLRFVAENGGDTYYAQKARARDFN